MIHTRNISIDDECLKKMEPIVERHQGNFSSAVREIINKADKIFPENSIAIDDSLFNWLLNEIDGRLIPDNVLDIIIDPSSINRMTELDKFINKRLSELDWDVDVIIGYDDVSSLSNILIQIVGVSQKIRLVACMICQFIIKNSPDSAPFTIKSVVSLSNEIKVELIKTANKKDGLNSLITFFGSFEYVAEAIKSRPSFWRCIINRHVLSNYNMVTVHRNYYEDILAGNTPMGEIMIETLAKRPIQDIPLKEILSLIKQVYEASRVVDRVDIRNNSIILFHDYRNKDAIEKIKKQLIMLLEANGHLYDGKATTNMLVFEHRPDIGMEINKIVNNLKSSQSNLDQELIIFLTFLKDVKSLYDTPMSISILGRRMGMALMQEYEKENNVKTWSLENFQKAFEIIDSKIHRDSEFKLEDNKLLYRIRKCNITTEGNTFDTYICRAAREAFKGSLDYAFRGKAELTINRLITHGDNYCEVIIRAL